MILNSFSCYCYTGGVNMIKKLIAGTMVLLFISGSSTAVYANPTTAGIANVLETVNETKIEEPEKLQEETFKLTNPRKNMVVTNTDIVLTFTAPEGTTVTIDVYYNTSVATNKQNYVKAYDSIEVEIGALQRGYAEVELKKGLNKIDFTAIYQNGIKDVISRIVEVKDIKEVKEQVEKSIATTSSTETLKNIANSGNI